MPVPPIAALTAPSSWRAVDCLSDLHLDAAHPATLQGLASYLDRTPADAVLILGDLFEVWVGDDAMTEPGSFEGEVCTLLARAGRQRALYFMHGNRDFLVGQGFARATGITLLADPTLLTLGSRRWLLSHGDALCLDDGDYQRFRAMVRDPAWQASVLAQPLAVRRAQARGIRSESEARKQSGAAYGDVDSAAALDWLRAAQAPCLVHGHTHRPADHQLAPGVTRLVLTDWDLDAVEPRAGVLRLTARGAGRLPLDAV
ncbi:MAG: UDP-2,3-diacylglucosamine diphosphatase [Burkholderiales bacterium 66-5]|nr:MAG: UDP-2,3-diacylglucosamine diphosphatase [Burkholderiales bacterium 66-5]